MAPVDTAPNALKTLISGPLPYAFDMQPLMAIELSRLSPESLPTVIRGPVAPLPVIEPLIRTTGLTVLSASASKSMSPATVRLPSTTTVPEKFLRNLSSPVRFPWMAKAPFCCMSRSIMPE